MSIIDYIGYDQIALLCLIYTLSAISRVDAYNIPHLLFNGLTFLFPTVSSLSALNGPAKTHKRAKAAMPRRHRTVADRIHSLTFESEKVQQAMCVSFAGYEFFNTVATSFLTACLGFCVIEASRVVSFLTSVRSSDKSYLTTINTYTTLTEFTHTASHGPCSLASQHAAHTTAGLYRHTVLPILPFLLATTLYVVGYAPHQYMYSKAGPRVTGVVFATGYFWLINTPPLMSFMQLPLPTVVATTTKRIELFLNLIAKGEVLEGETISMGVTMLLVLHVFWLCTGFAHSLSQHGKISGFVMKKEQPGWIPLKFVILLLLALPFLTVVSYFLPPFVTAAMPIGSPSLRLGLLSMFLVLHHTTLKIHLQVFLEASIQDASLELKKAKVNVEAVRRCFTGRASLVVYSAGQLMSFGCFLTAILAAAVFMGGVGVSHLGGYGQVTATWSAPYVRVQSIASKADVFGWVGICPVLTEYPDTPEYGALAADFDEAKELALTPAPSSNLEEFWERKEELKEMIASGGGYARAIFYHNEVDFDQQKLARKEDKVAAENLKTDVVALKQVVWRLVNHTFVSPAHYYVLADSLILVLCLLWLICYGGCVLLEFYSPDPMGFQFDVQEKKEEGGVTEVEPVLEAKKML